MRNPSETGAQSQVDARTPSRLDGLGKNFGALADKAIDDEFELKVQLKY